MLEYGNLSISITDVERYLDGLVFPADLDEIVNYAQDNDAPDEVIDALEQMPDREYSSFADVEKGFNEVYE